jgi:hypothetical protein
MDRILGRSAQERAREGSDILGGPPSSATVHQPLVCAETVGAGLWQPRR